MKEKIYVSVLNFPSAMVTEPTLGGGGREEEGEREGENSHINVCHLA